MSLPADGQAVSLVYALEPAFAQVPADGAIVRELIHNRSKVNGEPTIRGRSDISADHATQDMFVTGEMGRGAYYGELRIGQLDDAMAALLSTPWSSNADLEIVGNVAVMDAATVVLMAQPDFLAAGDIVKLSGFQTPGNNVYGRVASITTAGPLVQVALQSLPAAGLTVEAASPATRLHLANDVFCLNETDLTYTGSGFVGPTGEGVFAAAPLSVGQIVYLASTSVSGFFPVQTITTDEIGFAIPVNGYNPGDPVTIKGSRLANPKTPQQRVAQSLRFEVTWPDAGTSVADQGVKPDTLRIKAFPDKPVSFEMTTQSAGIALNSNVLVESRYSQRALQAGPALDGSGSTGLFVIKSEGIAANTASVEIDLLANWKPVRALGQLAPIDFQAGNLVVQGRISMLLDGSETLGCFVAGEHAIFSFTANDVEGRGYIFTVPDCIISSMPVTQKTPDGDVMMMVTFKATAKQGALIAIDRFSSIG